jgi:hypothetical protein
MSSPDHSPWMPPASQPSTPDSPVEPGATPDATVDVPAGEPAAWAAAASASAPFLPAATPADVPAGEPAVSSAVADTSMPFLPAPTPIAAPTAAAYVESPIAGIAAATPPFELPATNSQPRRARRVVALASVAVVAVGSASVFAVAGTRGAAAGGAATPEELGAGLLAAIENEDIVGALDLLAPGEREALGDPLIEAVEHLTRLGVLAESDTESDTASAPAWDVVLENESVVVESTNVADIVNIDLDADVSASGDPNAQIGDLWSTYFSADEIESALDDMNAGTTAGDELDVSVTAIEQDGRWYASIFHSAAEEIRADELPDSQIPLEGVGAIGAETPEAAIDGMFDAVEALDVEAMIQRLNPGEAAALQRYAPLFLADAEQAIADDVGDGFEWSITEREIRVEGEGDRRTAFIDRLTIEGTAEGQPLSYQIADGCATFTAEEVTVRSCGTDYSITSDDPSMESFELDSVFSEVPEVGVFFDTISTALEDMEPIGIELRRYEDAWYVSPIASYTEAGLKVMRAYTRPELEATIDAGIAAFEAYVEYIFGAWSDDEYTEYTDDDWADDEYTEYTEYTDDDWAEEYEPSVQDCWFSADGLIASECFADAVANGEVSADDVPIALRFPECGYAAVGWNPRDVSDADFMAAVAVAEPCFAQLVADGTLDEYDVPDELLHPECLSGRNIYATYDGELINEFNACIEAARATSDV